MYLSTLLSPDIGVILRSKFGRAHRRRNNDPGRGAHMQPWRIGAIGLAWLTLAAAPVSAQESFPNHAVRIVITYSPGSVAGAFGRIVTQNMAAQ